MPKNNLELCDFCGGCAAVCPKNAITIYYDSWFVDETLCSNCMICKKVCPMNAIEK